MMITRTDDLISRAAAIDALTDTNLRRNVDSVCDGDMNRTRRAAHRVIAQLPAIDAAPVVRCKDCRYYNTNYCGDGFGWCERKGIGYGTSDDWFCADGEK